MRLASGSVDSNIAKTHRVCVAPMMDYTDRHFRYLLRLLSKHTWLYTEMVTTGAILHGQRDRFLAFHPAEHPLALQLGGSNPAELATCARIGAEYGYDEINLNVGCPSGRVQLGRFGACLMAEPDLVAECVSAMTHACAIPVTVKTRIGIDDLDSYERLHALIEGIAAAGCRVVIIHARKAWLQGLSPKQNREVPPLRYDVVQRLKADFPQLDVIVNGGIKTLADMETHLAGLDGVMIGREACSNPYLFADVDRRFFDAAASVHTRAEVVKACLPYVAAQIAEGVPLARITRHLLGLYQGQPGARRWRRYLSEQAPRPDSGIETLSEALSTIREAA
ncbi:MAG TPA: tRNA dihydrouridine(20/20a) synthase DusA [Gammaproteobacteria bacterium]|nr:tRNA dihydrouridine(20/20a) synthase DusA [Gammaproteobacteria bacterium]